MSTVHGFCEDKKKECQKKEFTRMVQEDIAAVSFIAAELAFEINISNCEVV